MLLLERVNVTWRARLGSVDQNPGLGVGLKRSIDVGDSTARGHELRLHAGSSLFDSEITFDCFD